MADGANFADFPSWELLDFSKDCSVWGDWLGIVLTPDPAKPTDLIGPGYWSSINLFISSLPPNGTAYMGNRTFSEVYGRINEWYSYNMYYEWNGKADFSEGYYTMNPEFQTKVLVDPIETCQVEYCNAMAYVGNADLTGIGVWISYLIEALLVSAYLFVFTVWHIRRYLRERKGRLGHAEPPPFAAASAKPRGGLRGRLAKLSLVHRTLDSFRGTLTSFLSSAMLICIVMLSASFYLEHKGLTTTVVDEVSSPGTNPASTSIQFPYHSSSAYDMIMSFLASAFSIFPVLVLYAMKGRGSRSTLSGFSAPRVKHGNEHEGHHDDAQDEKHNIWIRRVTLFVIWILFTVEVFLSSRGNSDYSSRNDPDQAANIDPCNLRGGTTYWEGMAVAEYLVIIGPALWLIVTLFLLTGFGIPGVVSNRWIRRWRTIWRLGIAWLNLAIMWAVFFYFADLRYSIIDSAGAADTQNTWGFGQILALATWVPVFAEFIYIFIWGIEEGLEARLPAGFEIQRVDSDLLSDIDGTLGPDPYEIQQGGPTGNEKQVPLPSTVSVPATGTPTRSYGSGHVAGTTDHFVDPEDQVAPHITYDYHAGGYQQTPQNPDRSGW